MALLNAFKYDERDGWQKFRNWLVKHGAALMSPTSPWEIYRAETRLGIIVGYRNRLGKANHPPNMRELLEMFQNHKLPPSLAKDAKKKRQSKKWTADVNAVMDRDGQSCFYCAVFLKRPNTEGPGELPTIEHFLALSRGGPARPHHAARLALAFGRPSLGRTRERFAAA